MLLGGFIINLWHKFGIVGAFFITFFLVAIIIGSSYVGGRPNVIEFAQSYQRQSLVLGAKTSELPSVIAGDIREKVQFIFPFSAQAPDGVWDDQSKEACEEATLFLVHYFDQGNREDNIKPDITKSEIQKMIDWQNNTWRKNVDLTTKQVSEMAKGVYGYQNIEIKYNINTDDIKRALSAGYPVIVPTAGRELANPNFQNPGPIYHMLVIVGYDKTHFITADPGTKRGRNYRYPQQHLMDSIHDWTGNADTVGSGRSAMMVIRDH